MSCAHSASKPSASSSAWVWAFLPFIWALLALSSLKRLLRRPTPTHQGSTRRRNALLVSNYLIAIRTPVQPSTGPSDDVADDWDPSEPGDPWSAYLADDHIIEACRHHLARCFQRDPGRHDHP